MTALALRRPIPLFALAALLSIVGGLCIGAFPVGFAELLSAIGLSDRPLDDKTAAVLYAIRAPRVIAAFTVGAALAAGGAAMQSLFRNPLADPGLLGVSSGAALAAVSVIVLGEKVKGGHYGEMPSLKPEHLVQGDMDPNMDFRSVYSTILDKWLKLNPAPIVNGTFEQPAFLN